MKINSYLSKKEIISVFGISILIFAGYFIYGHLVISSYECKSFLYFNEASEKELQELPYISFNRTRIIFSNKGKITNFEEFSELLHLKRYEKDVLVKKILF